MTVMMTPSCARCGGIGKVEEYGVGTWQIIDVVPCPACGEEE